MTANSRAKTREVLQLSMMADAYEVWLDQVKDALRSLNMPMDITRLKKPHNRTPCFAKAGLTPDALADQVSKWFDVSFNARLSAIWRDVRSAAFEKSLYELDALEGMDFHRTVQRLLMVEAERQPDIDHALDFLERYVSRKIIADNRLREAIKAELVKEQLPEPRTKTEKEEARRREPAMTNAHCYIPAFDKVARTGDVVEVTHPKGSLIAVALTPACDLAHGKAEELRLVEAERSDRDPERDAEWQLAAVKDGEGDFKNFIVHFHRTFFVTDLSKTETMEKAAKEKQAAENAVKEAETEGKEMKDKSAKEAQAKERDTRVKQVRDAESKEKEAKQRLITYDDKFRDRFGTEVKLRCICRLDDPYRSDLLQKYSSHASRVGVP
jgi:hypothetical protein